MKMRWEKLNLNSRLRDTPVRKKFSSGFLGPGKRWGHTCNSVKGGQFIYVFGGYCKESGHTNDVHVFDTTRKVWSKPKMKGNPPSPRDSHSCTTVENNLYVFGGTDGKDALQDLFILDTSSNTWISPTLRGEKPGAREGHSAALIGKQLFMFGGCGKSQSNSDEIYYHDVYILDTDSLEWTRAITSGTPPSARDSHTCSAWMQNIIVVAGADTSSYFMSDVHILDTDTLVWRELDTLGQILPSRAGHSTVALGRNLLVFGGYTDHRNIYDDIHMLNLDTGTWTKVTVVGEGPSARFSIAADCLDAQKGVIVFLGGCNEHLEAADDMYYLHTETSAESAQEECRPKKSSHKKELKRKYQEESSPIPVSLPANNKDMHRLGTLSDTNLVVHSPSSNEAGNELDHEQPRDPKKVLEYSKAGHPGKFGDDIVDSPRQKKTVQFSFEGQPIGEESEGFNTYLGSVTMAHVPITYEHWLDVPSQIKEMACKKVMDEYSITESYKNKIRKRIAKFWREFKILLRKTHYDRYATDEERKSDCPKGISQVDWDRFVDNQKSPTTHAQQKSGKDASIKLLNLHTPGKDGAARVAETLQKDNLTTNTTQTDSHLATNYLKDFSFLSPEIPRRMQQIKEIAERDPSSTNLDIDHDPVAQVWGPEQMGRVRGIGFGVTKSCLVSSTPAVEHQQGKKIHISTEDEFNQRMLKMEKQIAAQGQIIMDLKEQIASLTPHKPCSTESFPSNERIPLNTQLSSRPSSPQGMQRCLLLYFGDTIVATGKAMRGTSSGDADVYDIVIDVVHDPNARLFRVAMPMLSLKDIELGATIKWPKIFTRLLP